MTILRRSCLLLAGSSMLLSLPAVQAEEGSGASKRVIEEMIVTATRRQATLQDVPVSVSVVTGEMIRELSLQNLDQLSAYVPGLSVVEGGEQTNINIRGFGAGLNFGFDQSVGLFIDGVYAGRERQFRSTFLDVGYVEVLRGPQATLFGKNTTSGAIIITTGQPTHEFSTDVFAEFTPETKRQTYQFTVNGGLTDTLAARLALRYSDHEGYLKNTFTGKSEEQETDWVGRLTLLWTPTDALSVRTKLERSEYERSGRNFHVSNVSGLEVGKPLASGADVTVASRLSTYQAYDPSFEFRNKSRSSKQPETADVTSTNATLKIDYDLPGGHTISATTGFSGFESEDLRDVDWTPTNFLYEPITQDFDQWSQEIQFISNTEGKFDYLVGVHAFKNEFYVDRRTDINIEPFLLPFGVTPFSETIFGGPASNWRRANLRFLDQETTSTSIFGSGTYSFTEQWSVTAGLRYSREKKEADDRYFLSEFGTTRFLEFAPTVNDYVLSTPVNFSTSAAERTELISLARAAGGDALIFANLCEFAVSQCQEMANIIRAGRSAGGSLTERDWSPEITLTYDRDSNSLYYAKLTRGHKGGGFNSQATGQNTDPTFEDETVTGYEIGGKLRLLDGIAQLNFALFRQDFDNLQTSVWTGTEFDVKNAGKARSQGLETDITYLATDKLQLNASFIWLDARYSDFANAACSVPQQAFGEPGCNYFVGTSGAGLQDLSGNRFAATLSGNAGVGYVTPVTDGLELLLRADAVYYGAQENPRDPTIAQGSRTIVDLGATLRSRGARDASIGILIQNATDKSYYWYEFEAPAQIGTRIGFPGAPRLISLRGSYSF